MAEPRSRTRMLAHTDPTWASARIIELEVRVEALEAQRDEALKALEVLVPHIHWQGGMRGIHNCKFEECRIEPCPMLREALATDQSRSDPDALREAARQLLGQAMIAESVDALVPYLNALEDAAGFCQQGQSRRSDERRPGG